MEALGSSNSKEGNWPEEKGAKGTCRCHVKSNQPSTLEERSHGRSSKRKIGICKPLFGLVGKSQLNNLESKGQGDSRLQGSNFPGNGLGQGGYSKKTIGKQSSISRDKASVLETEADTHIALSNSSVSRKVGQIHGPSITRRQRQCVRSCINLFANNQPSTMACTYS